MKTSSSLPTEGDYRIHTSLEKLHKDPFAEKVKNNPDVQSLVKFFKDQPAQYQNQFIEIIGSFGKLFGSDAGREAAKKVLEYLQKLSENDIQMNPQVMKYIKDQFESLKKQHIQ